MDKINMEFIHQLNNLNSAQSRFEDELSILWNLGIHDFYNIDKEKNSKLTDSYLKLCGLMKQLLLIHEIDLNGEKLLTFNDKVCNDFFNECNNFKNMIIGNDILQSYINSAFTAYKEYSEQIQNTITQLHTMGYKDDEIHIGSLGYESVLKRAKFYDKHSIYFRLDGEIIKKSDLYTLANIYHQKNPFYNNCCPYKVVIGDLLIYGLKNVPINHIEIITHNLCIIDSKIQGKSLGVKVVGKVANLEGSNLEDISSINALGGPINIDRTPIANTLKQNPIVFTPEDLYDLSKCISSEQSYNAATVLDRILKKLNRGRIR